MILIMGPVTGVLKIVSIYALVLVLFDEYGSGMTTFLLRHRIRIVCT